MSLSVCAPQPPGQPVHSSLPFPAYPILPPPSLLPSSSGCELRDSAFLLSLSAGTEMWGPVSPCSLLSICAAGTWLRARGSSRCCRFPGQGFFCSPRPPSPLTPTPEEEGTGRCSQMGPHVPHCGARVDVGLVDSAEPLGRGGENCGRGPSDGLSPTACRILRPAGPFHCQEEDPALSPLFSSL